MDVAIGCAQTEDGSVGPAPSDCPAAGVGSAAASSPCINNGEPQIKPLPFIHNIVATAQIHTSAPLHLDRLKQIFRFSSFNRRKFAAVTLRLVRPNCTILLFTSGKLVITGSKSSLEALLSAYRIRHLL